MITEVAFAAPAALVSAPLQYNISIKPEARTMSGIFRVGLVNRWENHDPRRGTNFANFLVQWHLYEPVFRASEHPGKLDSVLLDYPLQPEGSEDGSAIYCARVKPGACFSDG